MSELLEALHVARAEFEGTLARREPTDGALEAAAGTGSLADGRSTPGDGTSSPGTNCTCCCN